MSKSQAEYINQNMEANAELLSENKPTLKISLGDLLLLQASKQKRQNKYRK